MRKQSVGIALALGLVLMGFQNCSPTFLPEQTFQNDDHANNPTINEPEQYEGIIMPEELEAKAMALGKIVPTCRGADLKFSWPFEGVAYRDWVIVNYVDSNPAAGATGDYSGASADKAITYDGHLGMDIAVPNFRQMDGDFPVFASAAGTVVEVVNDQFDRNLSCTGAWNVVKIKHANGFVSIYGHLKKNSTTVAVGQTVVSGQKIGVVGSSGCSKGPHVHFQVADCNKAPVDPVKAGMFVQAPVYGNAVPTTLMDTVVENPVLTSVSQMLDPGGDPSRLPMNQGASLGMTVAGLKINDELSISLLRADQTEVALYKMVAVKGYPQSFWWFNFTPRTPGEWTAKYMINGVEVFQRPLVIE